MAKKLLIKLISQSRYEKGRIETLETFYPDANPDDWRETVAAQRVEVIKPDGHGGGTLQLGTELVVSADKSLLALMGASPGAPPRHSLRSTRWRGLRRPDDRRRMVAEAPADHPTYSVDLKADADACRRTRADTAPVLGLVDI